MYVLIDVEWVRQGKGARYITQAAARRVTESWESAAEFSCLVRPHDAWDCDWKHVAYSGYSPDEFMSGGSEAQCVERLAAFLGEDDTLCVWSAGTRKLIQEKYELYIGNPLPNRCICVNSKVYAAARKRGVYATKMYTVARNVGLKTPAPKHCSAGDISVMGSILAALDIDLEKKPPAPRPAPQPTPQPSTEEKTVSKEERNAEILAKVLYNYVFTPDSDVFHRPSCKLMLRANDIYGTVYYETVIKKRRPCKLCRPEPIERSAALRVKPPKPQSPPPETKPQEKIVSAKLLGDKRWVQIPKGKLVGCCHSTIHPGKLTKKMMDKHNCLGKKCKFFEKYAKSEYWIAEEQKRKEMNERKAERKKEEQRVRQMENELEKKRELFQSYADALEYEMHIVRLQRESKRLYAVFYVSENSFDDGDRFPNFPDTVIQNFPNMRIELRHIRDEDGHFVTTDEYMTRKGQGTAASPAP